MGRNPKMIEDDELDTEFEAAGRDKSEEEEEEFKSEDETSDDDLDQEEEIEFEKKKPVMVRKIVSNQASNHPLKSEQESEMNKNRNVVRREEAIKERYTTYSIPERVGVFDNISEKPFIESQNAMMTIVFGITEILNKLEKIEKNLGV
jgi:hypothetical protein